MEFPQGDKVFDGSVSKLMVLLTSCKQISILCLGINCDYSFYLRGKEAFLKPTVLLIMS